MAIRDIIRLGHPVLRQVAKSVNPDDITTDTMRVFIQDLWETMIEAGGMGLAAPQVGESLQVAVIEMPEHSTRYQIKEPSKRYVIFNPTITPLTEETKGLWEGCLSLPGLRGYVPRPCKIRVDYLDEDASEQSLMLEDFLAIVFQHEIDHLNGKLFIDRMTDMTKLSFEKEYMQFHLEEQ